MKKKIVSKRLNLYTIKTPNKMSEKKPSDSITTLSELVLPNDTNTLGNLMGGRLMHWMDIGAALAAMKHCNCPVVTASADNISFETPIKLGNLVTIEAKVTRAFNTSMEVYLKVHGEDIPTQYKYLSNEAYMTFVALDPHGHPRKVPALIPENEEEQKRYDGALRRRQLRLILSGRMQPNEATELKKLFIEDIVPHVGKS
ncbi:MAG: acyl-CoA thioesterase [Chitinophagaceae bacterium]